MLTHNGSGASLWERSEFANTTRADVFLSIHCNAAADQAACGFEVWTSPGQTDADAYATAIYNAVRAAFPWIKMRSDYDDGDPDKEARFHVLRKTYMPAVLIEFGFLTNPEDAEMLMDQSTREHYANAVTSAVTEVLPVGA